MAGRHGGSLLILVGTDRRPREQFPTRAAVQITSSSSANTTRQMAVGSLPIGGTAVRARDPVNWTNTGLLLNRAPSSHRTWLINGAQSHQKPEPASLHCPD
jgi:hypothetical protein